MIRFLHVADLHLGLRITRFDVDACGRVGEARFHALQNIRNEAAKRQVDFIVVAGDVFDDHTVSRTDAERAFEIFESKSPPIPTFIIPGNHDPLAPGGVWDRDPWRREQPHLRVHFLRESAPVQLPNLPVTLFPCPLHQRRSMDDPTSWISRHPRGEDDSNIRIGLAHGSLNVGLRLPEDDHLIRPDSALHYGLDYLALGHWHKKFLHPSTDGVVRTAYSGIHEPMGFPNASLATGWASFSADGDAERFHDDGVGTALMVSIDGPAAPPVVEPINVGRLRWSAETRDVTGASMGSLISDCSRREKPELTLLRLRLEGVLEPTSYERLDELSGIVRNRFHPGSSLDLDAVLVEPNSEELVEIVGDGVLQKVLARLKEDARSADGSKARIAAQALNLLYRAAWEAKSA